MRTFFVRVATISKGRDFCCVYTSGEHSRLVPYGIAWRTAWQKAMLTVTDWGKIGSASRSLCRFYGEHVPNRAPTLANERVLIYWEIL